MTLSYLQYKKDIYKLIFKRPFIIIFNSYFYYLLLLLIVFKLLLFYLIVISPIQFYLLFFKFLLLLLFLIVISPIQFFSTVQHGDPVTHTCTHSIFVHYHAPS